MKNSSVEDQRMQALTVACVHCGSNPGDPCVRPGTGQPLKHQPAHTARLQDSTTDTAETTTSGELFPWIRDLAAAARNLNEPVRLIGDDLPSAEGLFSPPTQGSRR